MPFLRCMERIKFIYCLLNILKKQIFDYNFKKSFTGFTCRSYLNHIILQYMLFKVFGGKTNLTLH